MLRIYFQKSVLCFSGLTAIAIGASILFAPMFFYASYGITLTPGPSMLSELRAPGAGLTALGAIMLAGLFRADWAPFSVLAALTVYIAFPVGRLVSLLIDGMPSDNILAAFSIEVFIAVLCIVAFTRRASNDQRSEQVVVGAD